MTAKDKAKELVEKFTPLVPIWNYYNDEPREEKQIAIDASVCALICVNEISKISSLISQSNIDIVNKIKPNMHHKNYWKQFQKKKLKKY